MIQKAWRILVCRGPECGDRRGSATIHDGFVTALRETGLDRTVDLGWQSCFGRCSLGPNVQVRKLTGQESRFTVAMLPATGPGAALYNSVSPADARRILEEHIAGGRIVRDLIKRSTVPPLQSTPVKGNDPK